MTTARAVARIAKAGVYGGVLIALLAPPAHLMADEEETPKVSAGALVYGQYDYELTPLKNIQGKVQNDYNAFDITRAYINVKAKLPGNIQARVTPDVVREAATEPTQTSIFGSLVFRLKYAYLEWDDMTTPKSWIKFGMHQTPWLDFEESINRYRFQGKMFTEREGLIPGSADLGLGYLQTIPGDFGEVNASLANGEGYASSEVNKYKSGQVRVTIRPLPMIDAVKGLRLSYFYSYGEYAQNQLNQLGIGMLSFEYPYLVITGQYLKSRYLSGSAHPIAEGYSLFGEVKSPWGLAAIARVDHIDPNTIVGGDTHARQIYGLAYWMTWKGANVGLLLDDEQVGYEAGAKKPYENRILAQTQVSF